MATILDGCCGLSASKRTALAKESQVLADVQRAADAHVTLDDSLAQVCSSPSALLSQALYSVSAVHAGTACW